MEDLIIRSAKEEDLEKLLSFEQEIIKAERPFDPTIRPSPVNYYNLKVMLGDPLVAIYVAEYKGEIISSGYGLERKARAYLDHEDYAYLGFMYTVPEFRGLGVNQRIIEALKEWALTKGLIEIRLTVYSDNIPALRAYEKAGFVKHIVEMRIPHK